MNNNKRVSVLIPCYNHARFVKQTLDSVLFDSYEDKEIIIIDDGSTDNSVEVIKKWTLENENKIRVVFKHRENKGINATLNELKALATGQYYQIIASDDYLLPDSIKKRMEILFDNPGKMVAFGDAHVINEKSEVIAESSIVDYSHGVKANLKTDKGILNAALFAPVFSGPLELINKDVFSIIGNFPENLLMEDWFFWQRVAIKKLAIFVDDYVCCYRRHSGNITNGEHNDELAKAVLKTCKYNYKLLNFGIVKLKFFVSILRQYKCIIKKKIIKYIKK